MKNPKEGTNFPDLPEDFISQNNHMLDSEIRALTNIKEQLDHRQIQAALQAILSCSGRIYITGSGTSSTVARRMAHTFTCSGAPSMYLDSGQCQHGYSALLQPDDVLIAISRGGETDEINFLWQVGQSQRDKDHQYPGKNKVHSGSAQRYHPGRDYR